MGSTPFPWLTEILPMATSLLTNPSIRQSHDHLDKGEAVEVLRVLHVINGEHYAGAERVQDLLA
ncbi:MAG: hypothetical protein ABFD16_20725, partial [Thermoguttaceae bacterium]